MESISSGGLSFVGLLMVSGWLAAVMHKLLKRTRCLVVVVYVHS